WHIVAPPIVTTAPWQLVPAAAFAKSLPETNTITGASSSLMMPSQFESCARPTTGVDHTSVNSGNCVAVGPQRQRGTALSGPTVGWNSQAVTQPPSSAPAQTGGSGRHLPPAGSGCVHMLPASTLKSPMPASFEPSAVSQ